MVCIGARERLDVATLVLEEELCPRPRHLRLGAHQQRLERAAVDHGLIRRHKASEVSQRHGNIDVEADRLNHRILPHAWAADDKRHAKIRLVRKFLVRRDAPLTEVVAAASSREVYTV